MTTYAYYSLFLKNGADQAVFKVQASDDSVTFFGLGNLGIDNAAAELATARSKPKSIKPSVIKAVVGDPTPIRVTAYNGTGRPYWRYSKTAEGTAQSHYSAPICNKGSTPTYSDLATKMAAIKATKVAELGTYGRLYLVTERNTESAS